MAKFILKAWTFLKGKLKFVILAALAVVFVALCVAVGSKNGKLNSYKAENRQLQQTVQEQERLIRELASMEAVRCEVSVTVKNTAVMGSNKTDIQQNAKQMAVYLRGEILEALEEAKNDEQNHNQ